MRENKAYWDERIDDYGSTTTFDIRFKTIKESIDLYDLDDVDVDDYWAHGWTKTNTVFKREDSTQFCDERFHRIFPTRYRLKEFRLSKSLRRVIKRNSDLRCIVRPLRVTREKSALYEKHDKRFSDYVWQPLHVLYPRPSYSWDLTQLMEACVFNDEKLIACSIFQKAKYSVSSDLAFWDPDYYSRSLGILTVLLEMQYAARKGLEFYYLTSYLKQDSLYQYALRFPALEFYDWNNDAWLDAKTPQAAQLLDQKLDFYYKKLDLKTYFMIFEIVAGQNEDVVGLAVVGSYARGDQREDSDLDVIILTSDVEKYMTDETEDWARRFGFMREQKIEDWGAAKTIRAFYKNGHEFEFNFVSPSWACIEPIDEGTRRVVSDGMKILYDPQGILENLQKAVSSEQKNFKRTD